MPTLPSNDELRSRIDGIYLGDPDVISQLKWSYSKGGRCHVLTHKSTPAAHNPPPALLHGCFKVVRSPFYFSPDGGFKAKAASVNFGGRTTEEEAMGKANSWARLERVGDEDILGYEDFPVYVKNLKALEGQVREGQTSVYSIVTDEGTLGTEIKIIHRMFESALASTSHTPTPSTLDGGKGSASTPGSEPSGSKQPVVAEDSADIVKSGAPQLGQKRKRACTPPAQTIGSTTAGPCILVPRTPEPTVKTTGGVDQESDDVDVGKDDPDDAFLGDEFGLQHWPVSKSNIGIRDRMVASGHWYTNPLKAYREGIEGVIPPSEYESVLRGATVQLSFTLTCHLIGGRATFSAQVGEIIVLKEAEIITAGRAENGSPSKRAFSGPSFSPAKRQRHH
ncbi:uncharacterized protein EI90DRAFT_3124938 [Cantharellus anzutake]|uniref:uncharacterized protein n=1 Tax=Cantharellus anzutake TaxID=1750568 RepID=UPI001905155A|nr:uncharacterized protein EI90DRAFT_3124938 [Cantharellus anzutake]KAF8329707.1 hypothetical protein EI90DRAFT_3124938 [Cantharellus anzutake]